MIKRYIPCLFLLAVLVLIALFPISAGAELTTEQTAVINDDDVWLYANEGMTDDDKLCILPKTYYVTLDTEYANCYSVYYGESKPGFCMLYGFIQKSKLTPKLPKVTPGYFTEKLTPKGNPPLYVDTPGEGKSITIAAKQNVYYLGSYSEHTDTRWYYVYVSGMLGYVSATQVQAFTVPPHPDSIVPPSPSPDPSGTPNPNEGQVAVGAPDDAVTDKVQILLIIAICIPAVIIVFMLFRGGKPPKGKYNSSHPLPPYDKDHYQ